MNEQRTITCAFCQGTGKNPHFKGTCPVCKGKSENIVIEPFTPCKDCHGLGQKRGTTLTCYSCGGLGVVPDSSKIFKKAQKEIEKARKEMGKERQELREKSQSVPPPPKADQPLAGKKQAGDEEEENPGGKLFCQYCGNKVQKSSIVKICLKCFQKTKNGSDVREEI